VPSVYLDKTGIYLWVRKLNRLHKEDRLLSKSLIAILACAVLSTGALARASGGQAGGFAAAQKLYNAGKYSEALASFNQYAAVYPTNALTHYYLAMCQQQLGHATQARQEYTLAAQYGDATLQAQSQRAMAALGARAGTPSASQMAASSRANSIAAASARAASASAASGGMPGNGYQNGPKVAKVLKFYADWCGPCKQFAPVFEAAKSKYPSVRFEEINIDDPGSIGLKQQYNIRGVPTLVYLDTNGRLINKAGSDSLESMLSQSK
jgi:thiol-disulfide isomerase/thioredoxin